MVLTVRHGPNFAPPGTSKPSEKDPPRLKRFRRNRPTNYSLGWQNHTSAFLGRKADLPEQADQLRNDAGFDFFEPISCHQRCSDLDKNLSALVTRSRDLAFPAWLTSPVTD